MTLFLTKKASSPICVMVVYYDEVADGDDLSFYFLDVSLGIYSTFLFLLNAANTIVFAYHFRVRRISARLYTLLSTCDFFTLIFHTLVMMYGFFHPSLVREMPLALATASTSILVFFLTLSNFTTTLLCVYRLLAVASPFFLPKKRTTYVVVAVLAALAVFSSALVYTTSLSSGGIPHWESQRMLLLSQDTTVNYNSAKGLIYRTLYLANAIAAFVVSAWGGAVLFGRRDETADQNRENLVRSLGTLIIMNVVYGCVTSYMLVLLVMAIAGVPPCTECDRRWVVFAYFIAYPLLPMTLSAFNPCLLILRGTEIKQFVWRKKDVITARLSTSQPPNLDNIETTRGLDRSSC